MHLHPKKGAMQSIANSAGGPTTLNGVIKNDAAHLQNAHDILVGYIQRNSPTEIQKAMAVTIMVTAMSKWKYSIVQAAECAADCTGYNSELVRLWASSYFLTQHHTGLDNMSDECVSSELKSERGSNTKHNSLVHEEEFKLEARRYVHTHACQKGKPNVTTAMFSSWVNEKYGAQITDECA